MFRDEPVIVDFTTVIAKLAVAQTVAITCYISLTGNHRFTRPRYGEIRSLSDYQRTRALAFLKPCEVLVDS